MVTNLKRYICTECGREMLAKEIPVKDKNDTVFSKLEKFQTRILNIHKEEAKNILEKTKQKTDVIEYTCANCVGRGLKSCMKLD